MAWEGSDLLGSCWTKHHPLGVGEIYIVGVSPQAQGRGLGRELVVCGLDHLYRTGSTTGMLYVDGDNKAAMWLYSELGFRPVRANRQYELVEM
jgi:mycothiol synthase